MNCFLNILVGFFLATLSQAKSTVINKQFKESSYHLIEYLVQNNGKNTGFKWLEPLVDNFGSRHLGSKALEDAIDFTVSRLQNDGFNNVHTEEVKNLPHWVRNEDEVIMLSPRRLKLNVLTIGGVIAANVIAPLIVLKNYMELNNTNVSGKIVLFAQEWEGYDRSLKYRMSGSILEKKGAVGLLVQSLGPFSLSTPHTGSGASGSQILGACVTLEEARLLQRLYSSGNEIIIQMNIKSNVVGKTTSRNTIFDIQGSEWPEEIILLSGHMDSWDVGQGALDDGGGMAAVWQSMNAILNLSKNNSAFLPKRTIRGVFWTAEEQGLLGAKAYYNAHKKLNKEKFFFVSETDQGAFRPKTYDSHLEFMGSKKQMKKINEIVSLLNGYGIPLTVVSNANQGDVVFWSVDGVPSANYVSEQGIDYYFYFHHTQADYLTIFKEGDIDYTAAIFGVLAHVLANIESWD